MQTTTLLTSLEQSWRGFGWSRLRNHIALALISLAGIASIKIFYVPRGGLDYVITIGAGYVALLLIGVSLIIGPVWLIVRRKNPVNVFLRRDVGIWAGITGLLHVGFGLFLNARGNILSNFLRLDADGLPRLLLEGRGLSNYIGLIATILLIVLLLTSNDLMLRRLKGKRWKTVQRLNYALAVLALVHTLIYQQASSREPPFADLTLMLTLIVLIWQLTGMLLYRTWRERANRLTQARK
ncbi:MAG: ferric reductase-like transmembrane domain-containing protein [Anaerolineae bacterium]|nr:ferric reductase-like transmembrane domain-containing protein [Anaerolineae bacterium]